MNVKLEWYEVMMAAVVGVRRNIAAMANGLKPADGYNGEDAWSIHIEGACGELAYAKATGQFWSGSVNTFRQGGDVGLTQVRTRSRDDYDLIVRERDNDDSVFVLVVGRCPNYRVVGSILAADAKARPEWVKTYGGRPPAWFVPASGLRPIVP